MAMKGYILSKEGRVVGVWSYELGNLSVTTKDDALKDALNRLSFTLSTSAEDGKWVYEVAKKEVPTMTPAELAACLAPEFECIVEKDFARTVKVEPTRGVPRDMQLRAYRGYVMKREDGGERVVGVWMSTPRGLITSVPELEQEIKRAKRRRLAVKVTERGEESGLPIRNYAWVNALLVDARSSYFLVPSWGVEILG